MPAGKHSSGKSVLTCETNEGPFNENQARRLRITCHHIDRTLCEIEEILNESASATAFPSYIDDLTPAQRELIRVSIEKIRVRLVGMLERQDVDPGRPEIPASRAISGRMYIVDIAADEIRPRRMRGYGSLPPAAAAELELFADDLEEMTGPVDRVLRDFESHK